MFASSTAIYTHAPGLSKLEIQEKKCLWYWKWICFLWQFSCVYIIFKDVYYLYAANNFFQLFNWLISAIFLWKMFSESCWTRSEQVKNDHLESRCRWFSAIFHWFQLFYFQTRIIPEYIKGTSNLKKKMFMMQKVNLFSQWQFSCVYILSKDMYYLYMLNTLIRKLLLFLCKKIRDYTYLCFIN